MIKDPSKYWVVRYHFKTDSNIPFEISCETRDSARHCAKNMRETPNVKVEGIFKVVERTYGGVPGLISKLYKKAR